MRLQINPFCHHARQSQQDDGNTMVQTICDLFLTCGSRRFFVISRLVCEGSAQRVVLLWVGILLLAS